MSFGTIPLSLDDKPDGFVLLSMYEKLESENAKLREELADAPKCETCEAMLDCDECLRADGTHKERRRLSAENAKLLEIIADLEEMLPKSERLHIHKTANAIADDNSKLRQLVRDMYHVIATLEDANDEAVVRHGVMLDAAHFAKRVHELGLEGEA